MVGFPSGWPQAAIKPIANEKIPIRAAINNAGTSNDRVGQLNLNTRVATAPVASAQPPRMASWGQVLHNG